MNPRQPIVLVDDNHDDLFILKRLLSRAGLKNAFVTFDHGAEAKRFLDAALRVPETNLIPAAIFSDKEMAELSGFELLRWVRQQPQLSRLPFYLMSSVAKPGDAETASALGVTRFFEKFPPQHVFAELFAAVSTQPPRG